MLRKLIIFMTLAVVAMASTQDAFAKPNNSGIEAALARCLDVNIEPLIPDD